MSKFLEWQKSILIYSTILATVLMFVGIILSPLSRVIADFSGMTIMETIKLSIGGWIGFIVVGTINNFLIFMLKLIVKRRVD